MDDPLRDRRSVKELAKIRQVVEISEKIGNFDGLSTTIEADLAALPRADTPTNWREKHVSGRLSFGFADAHSGVATLEGNLEAGIAAVCQRCLSAFEWRLTTELKLQFVAPNDVVEDREGYELWELDDEAVRPSDIVDEALIMAMPLSARHEESAQCVAIASVENGEKMTTPFASLRTQMDKGKKN